jgi:hypothetical protein
MQPCVKKQFRRRSEALRVMRSRAIPYRDGVAPQPYRCPRCGWYHIGHDFIGLKAARAMHMGAASFAVNTNTHLG